MSYYIPYAAPFDYILEQLDNMLYGMYDMSIDEFNFEQLHEISLAYDNNLFTAIDLMVDPKLSAKEMRKIRQDEYKEIIKNKYYLKGS